ncbi:MAG: hypothetical protein MJA83_08315, partial [Gammaproteobacteria bacterium]|nr:hypothetical protein [Gammaproteobacteria bacterium]
YNLMISQWERRNEIERPIRSKVIAEVSGNAYAYATQDQFIASVGPAKALELIDLTEQLVKSTDQLIAEMMSFLASFPAVAKRNVNEQLPKNHGGVIAFEPHESWIEFAKYEPSPNYKVIAELCDLPVEAVVGRYGTGY